LKDPTNDILHNQPDRVLEVHYDNSRQRRILLVRRDDGTIQLFHGEWIEPTDFQPIQWCDFPTNTICSTLDIARREAFGIYPWIRRSVD
jgi:hypothetical protein